MDTNNLPNKASKKELLAKGSIIALIISIPSLGGFFLSWFILGNLIEAAVVGLAINFIAMGFAIKIAKKFLGGKYH